MPAEFSRTPDDPFRASTDSRLLYFDSRRRQATARLISGLYQGKGLFLLTGRAGIGKTVLLRHLADQLHSLDGIVLLSPHPIPCRAETSIAQIFRHFETHFRPPAIRTDSSQLARSLQDFSGSDRYPVLLLDDAHRLSGDILKTIITLAALQTGERRLLSVVAAGPFGLSARIAELAGETGGPAGDRVIELEAMSEADAERMVRRRLHLAGGTSGIVDDEAIVMAARNGEGVPLAVLRLCRGALQVGNGDAATFSSPVVEPRAPAPPAAGAARADRSQPPRSKTTATSQPAGGAEPIPGRVRFGADAARTVVPGQWQPRTRRWRPGKFTFALAGLVLLVLGAGWTLSDRRDTTTATSVGGSTRGLPVTDPALDAHTWWRPSGSPPEIPEKSLPEKSPSETVEERPPIVIPAERPVPPPYTADLQPSTGGDDSDDAHYLPPTPAVATSLPDAAQKASPAKPRPRGNAAAGQAAAGVDVPKDGEAKRTGRKREIEALLAEGDARLAEGETDVARAAYERAFDKGSAEGALRIAEMFDPRNSAAGRGTSSPAEAILWYKDAARRGNKHASAALGGLEDWLEEAAGNGDPQARRVLDVWRAADAEPASSPSTR